VPANERDAGLQPGGQPVVHFTDPVRQQCQVPVLVKQSGLDAGNMRGKPLAMTERRELVLPAVQQQDMIR
jgi:hypothetical protein